MIPNEFLSRMKELLGADFDAFEAALALPSVRAFRVNGIKISDADFRRLAPLDATPIPDCEGAYYTKAEKPGALGAHHAGMIYMQDPSAMSTVLALDIFADWKILDTCAAPGGKTAQLASLAQDGVLVANEPHPSRCRALQGNVERMGCKNVLVTQTEPHVLASTYPCFFDLVLTDAPCSGEGMFRKYSVAGEEWSQENVLRCADRQKEILSQSCRCVKNGGFLLYSTCTFSKEENEEVIADFLQKHPEFHLCEVSARLQKRTAPGIALPDCPYDLTLTRRFYPHLCPGEGQYIALLQKDASCEQNAPKPKASAPILPSKAEARTVTELMREVLCEDAYRAICASLADGDLCLVKSRDTVFLCPNIPLPVCNIYAYGVAICTFSGTRAVVHHQFYSAFGTQFSRQLHLSCVDPKAQDYLRGLELSAVGVENGFCAVLFDGCAVGGGKMSAGTLKNHYPKGLRNH